MLIPSLYGIPQSPRCCCLIGFQHYNQKSWLLNLDIDNVVVKLGTVYNTPLCISEELLSLLLFLCICHALEMREINLPGHLGYTHGDLFNKVHARQK